MPLLLAPFLAFAMGAFAALAHGGALGARRLSAGRKIMAGFAVLSLWPATLYSALAETGWSLLYLVDPDRVPSAVLLVASVAASALGPLGYEAGARTTGAPITQRLALALGPSSAAAVVALAVVGRDDGTGARRALAAAHASGPIAIALLDVLLAIAFFMVFGELGRLGKRT